MEFSCTNVSKIYFSSNGRVTALDHLELRVEPHEFLCVVGPSGCGKTTLLKLLAGIQSPSSGSIRFERPLPKHIPRCAMVFQDHGLFPWMTILDNVAYGLEAQGVPLADRHREAERWLKTMGLEFFPPTIRTSSRGGCASGPRWGGRSSPTPRCC